MLKRSFLGSIRGPSFFVSPQVVVLESRHRIGGRAHTDRKFGFPVDLGAAWSVIAYSQWIGCLA